MDNTSNEILRIWDDPVPDQYPDLVGLFLNMYTIIVGLFPEDFRSEIFMLECAYICNPLHNPVYRSGNSHEYRL